jgi:FkbM family methyltransferase
MKSRIRNWLRRGLHTLVLRSGFRLERVKPFEAHLLKYMLHFPDFWFVQVGAYNGITSDPFCKFIIDGLWKGVLVEPQSRYCEILREIYQDRTDIHFANVAIADLDGNKELYRVSEEAVDVPYWASQLASFRREVIASHRDRVPDIERWIVSQAIPCRTLPSLVSEFRLPRLDLLAVDVEGSDFEVVQQIDKLPVLPAFVYYEHLHLSSQERLASWKYLADRGYRVTQANVGDTFARLS